VPGEPDHMLIKRTDWMFYEVTASSLPKTDFDGNVLTDTDVRTIKGGALIIHAGLLKGRPDFNATLHTHTIERHWGSPPMNSAYCRSTSTRFGSMAN
jgi:ribulose-5-phosphate 4-epimerase/fuculose-1-phosphate aldolase